MEWVNLGTFDQLDQTVEGSIAEFLGVASKLNALSNIEAGSVCEKDFATLNDDWQVRERTHTLLHNLNLPESPHLPCKLLSGGQLTKLKLMNLFLSEYCILLLDEPSNHLDSEGKEWLSNLIRAFSGIVVFASHDDELLACADETIHLSNLGLQHFRLNFSDSLAQITEQQNALVRQLEQVKLKKKRVFNQAQINREKAQKRAQSGKKSVTTGSQPKMAMDAKKDKAAKSNKAIKSLAHNRISKANETIQQLSTELIKTQKQNIYLHTDTSLKNKVVLRVDNWCCGNLTGKAVSFQVNQQAWVWLRGKNGSGKSSLLKQIACEQQTSSNILLKVGTSYLDQHYSLLPKQCSAIAGLQHFATNMAQTQARTLLAGIGFNSEKVMTPIKYLSGGEKMKLAILCISHSEKTQLLLLDEPDNHLDRSSKALLADALHHYQGPLILVSHDQKFVDKVTVNQEVELDFSQIKA